MSAKYRMSLTVVLSAALLAAALIVAVKTFFSDTSLDLTAYAVIGLLSIVAAGFGERAFRKKRSRMKQIELKKQKNRKAQRRRK